MPLSALFPQAHAQGGFLDFGWSVVNFFLPIEDIGIVLQQMAYAVSDPDKFEPDEFIISLINVVTIFPPAKPLKLVTTPLRALFRSLKAVNPKFVKHFGGMFSGVMNTIGAFQAFNAAYVISAGSGGPADSLLFYTLYIYQQGFVNFDFGYASALGWLLIVAIATAVALLVMSTRRLVHYGDEG